MPTVEEEDDRAAAVRVEGRLAAGGKRQGEIGCGVANGDDGTFHVTT